MAKTICIQIFLEPKQYLEMLQEAKNTHLIYKNDSDLIRKIIYIFLEERPSLKLMCEQLRKGIAQRDEVINKLQVIKDDRKA